MSILPNSVSPRRKVNVTRRNFLKLVAGSSAGALVAGYSTSRAHAATGDFDWKKYRGTDLRYLGWVHPWSDAIKANLPEFEELTGIKVYWEQLPQDQHRQKVPTELTAKNKDLDLIFMSPEVEGVKYFKAGWLHPIDEYLADPKMMPPDFDLKDFGEGAVKTGNVLGKQILVPHQVDPPSFSYRKDLFSEKGIKAPETFDQMEGVMGKVHAPPNIYGFVSRGTALQGTVPWALYLYGFGGEWLTKDRKPATSAPECIKAIEFWARLCTTYGPPGISSFNWAESSAMIAQGKAATEGDSIGLRGVYEAPDKSKVVGKIGYAMFPAGPGGQRPWVWTAGNAIPTYSQKKEAAWYFILWTLSKQNQIRTNVRGIAATRTSAWKAPEMDKLRQTNPDWIETTLKSMAISDKPINPPVVAVMEYRTRVGEVLVKALQGLKGDALKEEAAKADKALQAILDRTEK
jgi:multiple sugar transport system substrate-binding protein